MPVKKTSAAPTAKSSKVKSPTAKSPSKPRQESKGKSATRQLKASIVTSPPLSDSTEHGQEPYHGIPFHVYNPIKYVPEAIREVVVVTRDKRKTSDIMSRYEYTEIISIRAKHIQSNPTGVVFTDVDPSLNPIQKAEKEVKDRKCPLSIMRMLNSALAEVWDVNEMDMPDQI